MKSPQWISACRKPRSATRQGGFHGRPEARLLRRHYARLAYLYSDRCADALLEGRIAAARRWARLYREAAHHCRLEGELLRGERAPLIYEAA